MKIGLKYIQKVWFWECIVPPDLFRSVLDVLVKTVQDCRPIST